MSHDLDRPPLSRPLKVDEIKDSVQGEIEATPSELAAIAKLLDLKGLGQLTFTYRLNRGGCARLRLTGRLTASATQTCVVSLEPVESSIDVPAEAEFWREELIDQLEKSADEPGGPGHLDWPEPIVDGKIDLGPFIYETLATSLDPYPRKQGVSFDWSQGAPGQGGSGSGPFAALVGLKRRLARTAQRQNPVVNTPPFQSIRMSFPGVAAASRPHGQFPERHLRMGVPLTPPLAATVVYH